MLSLRICCEIKHLPIERNLTSTKKVHLCWSQCPFRDKTDLAGHMEIHENNFCQLSKQSCDSRKELDAHKKVHLSIQMAKQQTVDFSCLCSTLSVYCRKLQFYFLTTASSPYPLTLEFIELVPSWKWNNNPCWIFIVSRKDLIKRVRHTKHRKIDQNKGCSERQYSVRKSVDKKTNF